MLEKCSLDGALVILLSAWAGKNQVPFCLCYSANYYEGVPKSLSYTVHLSYKELLLYPKAQEVLKLFRPLSKVNQFGKDSAFTLKVMFGA